jgi:hypothetical protein
MWIIFFLRNRNTHINYDYDLIAQNEVENIVMMWTLKKSSIIGKWFPLCDVASKILTSFFND